MASKGEELNTRITATDDASAVVDKVADKVGDLEDRPHEVEIDADTSKAEEAARQLDKRLEGLTDDEKRVVLDLQAKNAQRDLDRINRELANAHKLTDDELRLRLTARDELTAKLQAVKDEIAELPQEAEQAGTGMVEGLAGKLSVLPGRLGGIGEKLGTSLGRGLLGGLAALGVGAGVVQILQESIERNKQKARLTAAFDLDEAEVERFGRIAGDAYARGVGESSSEVAEIVARIDRDVAGVARRSDAELGRMAEQASRIASTFGLEVPQLLRSASQLVENGLVPNLSAAFDIIVSGFQRGVDEAGDWLETIDEYSQHWSALGLTAEDVLASLSHGIQNGQRDTDKLADAMKEFRIRAVEDTDTVTAAFASLGLNANDVRLAILAGGPAARSAYQQVLAALAAVEDPIERQRLAVELLGTQFEDLGANGLTSLQQMGDGLDDVTGKAEQLAKTLEEAERPFERLLRNGQNWAQRYGDAIATKILGPLDQVDALINGLFGGDSGNPIEDAVASLGALDRARPGPPSREERLAAAYAAIAAEVQAAASAEAAAADQRQAAMQPTLDFLAEARSRANDLEGALEGAFDLDEMVAAANASIESVGSALETLFQGIRDEVSAERGWLDLQDQIDRVRESAEKLAEARTEGAEEAEEAERNYRREQLRLLEQTLSYLSTLDKIPAERVTRIRALIDAGNLEAVEAELAALSRDRYTRVVAEITAIVRDSFSAAQIRINPGQAPSAPVYKEPTGPVGQYVDQRTTTNYFPTGVTPMAVDQAQRTHQRLNGDRPV